ncbi:MAG: hypothetical protein ACI4KM_12805 [Oscillospiraceae bacterium]
MNKELLSGQASANTASPLPCDGATGIKLSKFNAKQGKPIKLTNDERRALITIFSPKKKKRQSWITVATGIGFAFFGAVIGVIIGIEFPSVMGILAACFAIPGFVISAYGIYGIATSPNIEKGQINAYEFTVEGMFTYIPRHGRNPSPPIITRVTSISAQDSVKFMTEYYNSPKVILCFGGNTVKLMNQESFSVLHQGITVGDKIRCAVLEYGNHCCISIF